MEGGTHKICLPGCLCRTSVRYNLFVNQGSFPTHSSAGEMDRFCSDRESAFPIPFKDDCLEKVVENQCFTNPIQAFKNGLMRCMLNIVRKMPSIAIRANVSMGAVQCCISSETFCAFSNFAIWFRRVPA